MTPSATSPWRPTQLTSKLARNGQLTVTESGTVVAPKAADTARIVESSVMETGVMPNAAGSANKTVVAKVEETINRKLDLEYFQQIYGKENVIQGGGNRLAQREWVTGNIAESQLGRNSSNFNTIVIDEDIRWVNPKNLISQQSRNEMSGSVVRRLEKDMRKNGFDQTQPISVIVRKDGRLVISDGHHRTAAAIRADIDKIPVDVFDPLK